jgi:hypothetical protein
MGGDDINDPYMDRNGWRVKIHFQQDDGPTLRRQLVAIEIYSNDIITEGYLDSLLFAFCNALYEHGD